MRILYASHTSQVSGGERSLLDLLAALPDGVEPWVASPPGPLVERVKQLGVPVVSLAGIEGSLTLHPANMAIGLGELARDAVGLRRIAGRVRPDLVHANSIRAGLVGGASRALGGPPVVTHVRDTLPPRLAASAVLRMVDAGSRALVANSEYTAQRLRTAGVRGPARVVHSPVDLARFDPASADRASARAHLGLSEATAVLAVVAQITPWKNQGAAIEILAGLRRQGYDAELLLVGSPKFVSPRTRHDNPAYLRELELLSERLSMKRFVHFLGEREDVPQVLAAVDVVLAPSWEEPFGRSVVEAMAMGVPVAATDVGGPAEIIGAGVGGVLLPPRQPERWVAELRRLLDDASLRAAIGARGRQRVREAFGVPAHVAAVIDLYSEVAGR